MAEFSLTVTLWLTSPIASCVPGHFQLHAFADRLAEPGLLDRNDVTAGCEVGGRVSAVGVGDGIGKGAGTGVTNFHFGVRHRAAGGIGDASGNCGAEFLGGNRETK
jgi:hypothetical protein